MSRILVETYFFGVVDIVQEYNLRKKMEPILEDKDLVSEQAWIVCSEPERVWGEVLVGHGSHLPVVVLLELGSRIACIVYVYIAMVGTFIFITSNSNTRACIDIVFNTDVVYHEILASVNI